MKKVYSIFIIMALNPLIIKTSSKDTRLITEIGSRAPTPDFPKTPKSEFPESSLKMTIHTAEKPEEGGEKPKSKRIQELEKQRRRLCKIRTRFQKRQELATTIQKLWRGRAVRIASKSPKPTRLAATALEQQSLLSQSDSPEQSQSNGTAIAVGFGLGFGIPVSAGILSLSRGNQDQSKPQVSVRSGLESLQIKAPQQDPKNKALALSVGLGVGLPVSAGILTLITRNNQAHEPSMPIRSGPSDGSSIVTNVASGLLSNLTTPAKIGIGVGVTTAVTTFLTWSGYSIWNSITYRKRKETKERLDKHAREMTLFQRQIKTEIAADATAREEEHEITISHIDNLIQHQIETIREIEEMQMNQKEIQDLLAKQKAFLTKLEKILQKIEIEQAKILDQQKIVLKKHKKKKW